MPSDVISNNFACPFFDNAISPRIDKRRRIRRDASGSCVSFSELLRLAGKIAVLRFVRSLSTFNTRRDEAGGMVS